MFITVLQIGTILNASWHTLLAARKRIIEETQKGSSKLMLIVSVPGLQAVCSLFHLIEESDIILIVVNTRHCFTQWQKESSHCRTLQKKQIRQPKKLSKWIWQAGELKKEPVVGYVFRREKAGKWLRLAAEGVLQEGEVWRSLTQRKHGASWGLGRGQEFYSDILFISTNLNKSGQRAEVHPLWGMTRHDAAFRRKSMSSFM
jgi:hypothetical protein